MLQNKKWTIFVIQMENEVSISQLDIVVLICHFAFLVFRVVYMSFGTSLMFILVFGFSMSQDGSFHVHMDLTNVDLHHPYHRKGLISSTWLQPLWIFMDSIWDTTTQISPGLQPQVIHHGLQPHDVHMGYNLMCNCPHGYNQCGHLSYPLGIQPQGIMAYNLMMNLISLWDTTTCRSHGLQPHVTSSLHHMESSTILLSPRENTS